MINRGNPKELVENIPQCHLEHHESHMKSPESMCFYLSSISNIGVNRI
jgi:hypothetical protein